MMPYFRCLNALRAYSSSTVRKHFFSTNGAQNDYSVRRINLNVCGKLYERLRDADDGRSKLYRNSPSSGVNVDIEFADTNEKNRNSGKNIIVAIHGMPGSHADFAHLIRHFAGDEYRVIAPNLPGIDLTRRTQQYWQSAEERAQVIRDLLSALNIHTVDTLVCHSGGLFPGSYLWSEKDELKVKSVALFNTPSSFLRWSKPRLALTSLIAKSPILSHFVVNSSPNNLKTLAKLFGYPSADRISGDQLTENALMSINSGLPDMINRFNYLRRNRIPTVFLMSENDALIEKRDFYRIVNILNGNNSKENMLIFDGDKTNISLKSDTKRDKDSGLQIINIRPGGHFAFIKYSNVVNPFVENLIKTVS